VQEQAEEAVDSLFNAKDYGKLDDQAISRRFMRIYEFVRASRNVSAIPRSFIDDNTDEEE
jgi:hypothetical protein